MAQTWECAVVNTRITTEMIHAAYDISKSVYLKDISQNDAANQLSEVHGMSNGSATAYIQNFQKMMSGEKYTRTLNAEATDYFLTQILSDFDIEQLGIAIHSVKQHVDAYERLSTGKNLPSIRAIMALHEKIAQSQPNIIYPDEINEQKKFFEGARKSVTVNAYERSGDARRKCVQHHGTHCCVCDFDFHLVYGDIGQGYIHVHHITPLASIGETYEIDPIEDLRPVCPNCHAMLHQEKPPYTVDELQILMHNEKQRDSKK